MTLKAKLLAGTVLVLAILSLVLYLNLSNEEPLPSPVIEEVVEEVEVELPAVTEEVIGVSVDGRNISVTTFGTGDTNLLFVGGIHGGYEWNSALLAYEMIDHLRANPNLIPADLSVSIIPDLNPDGTFLVTGKEGRFAATDIPDPSIRVAEGRFNQNRVDLNRNFDCKWEPESTWRGNPVSAGTAPFSEPEAAALRDYVLTTNPSAAVFWHSQANNVYASECENGVLSETLALMSTYAQAASYGEVPVFDAYPITGDVEGWLASINIPAVTVELETHNSIEWTHNLNGLNAVIDLYSSEVIAQ